jgi:6-phosphogluconolactonase/glucosamine-6-phosphate isomerase/deaminase
VICSSKNIAFVCTGEGKRDALTQIFNPITRKSLPSGLIDPASYGKAGEVVWFIDRSASPDSKL